MTLYRNVCAVPLDGFAEGKLVFPQKDVELTDDDLARPLVTSHLTHGTLVPVTLAGTTSTPAPVLTPDQGAAQK